jgi:hypothetical protein
VSVNLSITKFLEAGKCADVLESKPLGVKDEEVTQIEVMNNY